MPQVNVGGVPHNVPWAEWLIAIMPVGTAVKFKKKNGDTGIGVLAGSSFYEGIIAHVDCCGKRVYIHPDLGERIRRMKTKDPREHPYAGYGI